MKIHYLILQILLLWCFNVDAAPEGSTSYHVDHQSRQRKITGTVTDENNAPIPGVTVSLKHGKETTVTDAQGIYRLSVSGTSGALAFYAIGYVTKEMQLSDLLTYDVVLEQDVTALDEVVVVGYGTAKRKDLTGAVGEVRVSELQKAPVSSFADALAGRTAGVQVTSADGQPGAMPSIIIRGANSVTQDVSPLYVIDGFPIEDFNANLLNPSDIQSIDVLKDASATAIYGSRGANGVIMVTTKKGVAGRPTVTYDNWFASINNLKRTKMEMMTPYEFVRYQLELNPASAEVTYLSEDRTLEDYRNVEAIDWQDLLFRRAFGNNHVLALNGGTENTKFALSLNANSMEGTAINSGFSRYQGRFSIDQNISKKIRMGVNLNYTRTKTFGQFASNGSPNSFTSDFNYSAWGSRPTTGDPENALNLIDEGLDPEFEGTTDYRYNPVINAENLYNPMFSNFFLTNMYAEYNFLKYFKLRVTGGVNKSENRRELFYNSNTAAGDPRTIAGAQNGPNGSVAYVESENFLNENTLNYDRHFGQSHHLTVLGGITAQSSNFRTYGLSAIQVPNEVLGVNGLDEGIASTLTAARSTSTLASFLGRINYSFKGKYLLTTSFRSDGSSKFSVGNKWDYFPSGSFAWRFSDEAFAKKLNFISNGKLRLGYGQVGNNRVSDFAYLSTMQLNQTSNSGNTTSGYPFNNTPMSGIIPVQLGNEFLKWERTAQWNFGLDLGLFKDRVSLVVDYYDKKTTDLLLNASMASSTGFIRAFKNIGSVRNNGWEFTLNTTNISTPSFQWTSSFNISFNKNKVLGLTEGQEALTTLVGLFNTQNPYIAIVGQPVAQMYGYIFDGLYQLDDFTQNPNGSYTLKPDVPNNGNARTSIQPGHIKYVDVNGDGEVNGVDRTVIGNPNPIHIGGFSNTLTFKNFDLHVFFQWSYGNDLLNVNRVIFEGQLYRAGLNMFRSYANRWTPENPNTNNFVANGGGPSVYSSLIVEDGSYLRFKTLSLGYTMRGSSFKILGISDLRVYMSGQNLFTWTNYSGPDPEVNVRPTALTPGVDYSPYPRASTVTLGLNAKF